VDVSTGKLTPLVGRANEVGLEPIRITNLW
jgi:hypothetical protein